MLLPKKVVPATEVKNRFGDYLGEVLHKEEPILIERHGRPVAVLVSASQWQEKGREKRVGKEDPWLSNLNDLNDRIAKNHPRAKPWSAVDMIRSIREEEMSGSKK